MKEIQGPQDWRALCELTSMEPDPEKLLDLIVKINQALEECNRQSRVEGMPIKIKNVLLPANTFAESRLELPGVVFQQATFEYDC
jgi:hypothetical protein